MSSWKDNVPNIMVGVVTGFLLAGLGTVLYQNHEACEATAKLSHQVAQQTQVTIQIEKQLAENKKVIQQNKSSINHMQKDMLVFGHKPLNLRRVDVGCLERNVFYEAGISGRVAMIAVAQVTMNRVEEGQWGHSVCSVVYAPGQFSWTANRQKRWAWPRGKLWAEAKQATAAFLDGARVKGVRKADFYYTDIIAAPNWTQGMQKVAEVQGFVFYTSKTS